MNHIEIEKYRPCTEALRFRMQYNSFQEAWAECPRGDWMLWSAQRVGVDLRTLTRAKALCALTVQHLMKDERSGRACDIALKFADGEATREELDDAAAAADDADAAAAADADAAAAAAAAAFAAAAAARIKSQQQTAEICREHLKIGRTHV